MDKKRNIGYVGEYSELQVLPLEKRIGENDWNLLPEVKGSVGSVKGQQKSDILSFQFENLTLFVCF